MKDDVASGRLRIDGHDVRAAVPAEVHEDAATVVAPGEDVFEDRFGRVADGRRRQAILGMPGQVANVLAIGVTGVEPCVVDAPEFLADHPGEGDAFAVGRPFDGRFASFRQSGQLTGLAGFCIDAVKVVFPPFEQRVAMRVAGDDQFFGIGRPVISEPADGVAVEQFSMRAGFDIDNVERKAGNIEIAVAVEPVEHVVDDAGGNAFARFFTGLFCFVGPLELGLTKRNRQLLSVGRPLQRTDRSFGKRCERRRFATGSGDGEDLRSRFFAAGEEGDGFTIGRPARMPVLAAGRELSWFSLVRRDNP